MAAGSSSGGGSQGIKAGRAYVEVGTNDAGLRAGLNAAKRAVLTFGKELTKVGAAGLGVGAAIVGPIAASFKEMVEHYGKFQDLADRTGASAEDLSALGYAAKLSDASLEDVANGAKFLQKNLLAASEGSDEAVEAFGRLGLKAEDLKGKEFGEQMEMIAEGMRSIPGGEKGAVLEKVLGKGARALLPMLKDGAAGLKAMRKEAEETGSIISGEDAKKAEQIGDAIEKSWTAVKNTFMSIGAALLPQVDNIETFSNAFVSAIRQVREFITENRAAVLVVLGVGSGIAAAGAALLGLGLAITVTGAAISGLVAAGSALIGVLGVIFSPVGLVVAAGVVAAIVAIALALEAFPELFDDIATTGGQAWGSFADTFATVWGGIKDALAAGDLSLAFEIAVQGIRVVWADLMAWIQKQWVALGDTIITGGILAVGQLMLAVNRLQVALGQSEDKSAAISAATRALIRQGMIDRRKDAEDAADDAAQEEWNLKKKRAKAAELARKPPVELGPMPREVARRAAVEGLGNVRGQFGGYGAGSSLGVSGDSIQKQQLAQLEDINENTKEGRGLVGV